MGVEEPLGVEGLGYRHPRVSPDGTRLAVSMLDSGGGWDIYIYDLDRGTPTRLTFDPAYESGPLWSADGETVVFRSVREGGGIFRRRADGTGDVEPLITGSPTAAPFSLSRDGTVLVFGETATDTRDDMYTLSLESGSSPVLLLQTEFDEEHGALSPDGRWLAYTTDEAGQEDIYVRPFPNVNDRKWRISTEGGREPLWGRDGSELFYRGSNGVTRVRIETEPTFRAGTPELLFEGPYARFGGVTYDLAPDGRFVVIRTGESTSTQINVVLNWFEELKRLVPTE
jgi:Tol biopolymer transport system component